MAIGDYQLFFLSTFFLGFEIIDRSGQEEKVWVKYQIKVNINCVCTCIRRGMLCVLQYKLKGKKR